MNSKGSSGLFFPSVFKVGIISRIISLFFLRDYREQFPAEDNPCLKPASRFFFSLRVHVDADIVYNELLTLASLKCRRCQETLEDKMLTLPRIMCLFPFGKNDH